MKTKLQNALSGNYANHIFPFFWQHGEDDETLLTELHKIYESGIRSVCVEGRPYEDFGKEPWFEDVALILAECKKLGMEFWLLDDKRFPTGQAGGLLKEKYPHLGKRKITERHFDVLGPAKDISAFMGLWMQMGQDNRMVGVVACKRYPDSAEQRMTGEAIDITHCYDPETGMVNWDVPEGYWRIFMLIDQPMQDGFIDMLREESVHVQIEGVYEPHYQRFKEYFGNTFRGFFSDEPFIMDDVWMPHGSQNRSKKDYPWNEFVKEDLASLHGESWLTDLPTLWFPSDTAPKMRVDFMEVVTKRYEKCFCYQLGDWCREHGVEYIGHVVEDNDRHTGFSSGGHFFRSLNGQDMAGIDVVLCQIVPGMSHNNIVVPCHYDISDADFFHFGLAKLGSSHGHIQPLKKGRAMCEIFGAYGWPEGIKMMKWLTDHMLVRGINNYVPHSFTPKYPDQDCYPHFYEHGHNPEFRPFGKLMGYMNRVSDILSDGLHHAAAAVFYHAVAEWSGEDCMPFEKPGKVLTENQIDFDVIPMDVLSDIKVENGRMWLNGENYRVFVLPYAKVLPKAIVEQFANLAKAGLPVWCVNDTPEKTVEGERIPKEVRDLFHVVPLNDLAKKMQAAGLCDVTFQDESNTRLGSRDLRVYHYTKDGGHAVFVTHEGVESSITGKLWLEDFAGTEVLRYDPMENKAWRQKVDGSIPIKLDPYGSVLFFFGELGDVTDLPLWEENIVDWTKAEVSPWHISFAAPEVYDPATPDFSVFDGEEITTELYNIVRRHKKFCGYVKYETELTLPEGATEIDLGQVGEAAWVWIDGKFVGDRIAPPYRVSVNTSGKVCLTVVTTSHPAYAVPDYLGMFIACEPVGLLGDVMVR